MIYILTLDTPGRYIVGECDGERDVSLSRGYMLLKNPAHMTVLKGFDQSVFTAIDVTDVFCANLLHFAGFGELSENFAILYKGWLEIRRNPPDFEVQEVE